jgi:hypothetical protein
VVPPQSEDIRETDAEPNWRSGKPADEFSHEGNWIHLGHDTVTDTRTQLIRVNPGKETRAFRRTAPLIVFTSDRDSNYGIYRVNRDGSGLRLTE